MHKPDLDTLLHIGVKRRSGRYPWGSGEDPRSGSHKFLSQVDELRGKGLGDTDIAKELGITTTQLRNKITWSNDDIKNHNKAMARTLNESGLSNVAIGQKLGVSEGTVRNYLSEKTATEKVQKIQLDNVTDALKSGVSRTGYLDVGIGVERQLGVARTKFNAAVNKLVQDEGYHIHTVQVQRLSDPTGSKWTAVKVLTKDPDLRNTTRNSAKIKHLDVSSDDHAQTLNKQYAPHMLDLKRIKVRYAEDGGADKDGLIELRRGVEDLDLGKSRYAQVRIGAGENLYLKGMAAYSDADFPKGVDIIFNTNKGKDVPVEKVLKEMKKHPRETDDPSEMFGSSVTRQKGALNIVNEQGDWDTWSRTLSSQFLSKQPTNLIKDRLDDTFNTLRKEYDEINSLTNPVVKKKLMEDYIGGLDAKAKQLKAKGLKDTMSHVLLPFPDMKPNEIFAPNYEDGTRVALVRHPHGGKFEIPDLIVNNKNASAKKMIGTDAPDAVGIHPSVAQKLSGADFDGDTAIIIPNNKGMVKSDRTLKELKNFDHLALYKVDKDSPINIHVKDEETGQMINTGKTITDKAKQTQMGLVSNLITDMTIKGASNSELAKAVKHSMVVIDAEKHNLDWKRSERENHINLLRKRYQRNVNPDTGKVTYGASTLISRSKNKVDISQHETVRELANGKIGRDGKVLKEGLSKSEIAKKLKISEKLVNDYLQGKEFDPDRHSSGTAQEQLYSDYIKSIMGIKKEATASFNSIPTLKYSKDAAKLYKNEIKSLDDKLNTALLNAPKARQTQIMTNDLFYSQVKKGMTGDEVDKLKSRSLAKAQAMSGASIKRSHIKVTEKEWEAIQAGAVSPTKLMQILDNADMKLIRKFATPRESKLNSAKATRAKALIDKGYTFAQVAEQIGVSPTTLRDELGLRER